MAGTRKGGINNFTVQESVNMGLGQQGSMFVTASGGTATPPAGHVFVAITSLFPTLIENSGGLKSPEPDKYPNTEQASSAGGGTNGDVLDNLTALGPGITIFGRWNQIDLNMGEVIAYIGK